MPTLTDAALQRAIALGETTTVELKKAVPRPSELAERMCGMANAHGGLIIIGVEDSSLEVVGVPDARMALTHDMVLRAARQIDPPLLLEPAELEVYVLDGKRVVVATIPQSRGPIYQASGVFWVRRGESIRVFYYADRIEVHSPGLLLPGVTIEQMRRGEMTSKLRNPILAGLLRDIPGYMERVGSGIRLMLEETKHMGLPPPQFREMSEFVVTFSKAPVVAPARPASSGGGTLWDAEAQQQDVPAHESLLLEQEQRMQHAMHYIREHGAITNTVYRELTGVSEATARRDLEALVERGALRGTGKTRGRQYRLP